MDDDLIGPAVQYDGNAEAYAARHAASSPYNAGIDRPAILALFGDVNGLRILDAGCGPGLYAEASPAVAPWSPGSTRATT